MFFEEARELLLSLEEGLMELERRKDDRAHLDKTFRAAHSIKGAAAMVGMSGIADFTHGVEAVLDKVRNKTLNVDSDVISTLLEARDHLATAVEAEAAGFAIPAPIDLIKRLEIFLQDPATITPPPAPARPKAPVILLPPEPPIVAPTAKKPRAKKGAGTSPEAKAKKPTKKSAGAETPSTLKAKPGLNLFRISLRPGPEMLKRGVNPLGVLDELRDLGSCKVTTDPDEIPSLAELDPERCFFTWNIELETAVGPDRLDDVFLFVAEDSTVTIEQIDERGIIKIPPPAHEAVAPSPAVVATKPKPLLSPLIPPKEPLTAIISASDLAATILPKPAPSKPPAPEAPRPLNTASNKVPTRIRVDAGQLDDLVGLAGELAVLSDNLQGLRELEGSNTWITTLEALDRVSRLIRDTTLELRMVPVEELFSRFPRVVRDLADRSGKEIELRIVGQDTRLDRTIVERLSEPMIHLIRNAVDHGLETPEERQAMGKPRMGRITLQAGHEGDRVALRIEEDGRGLNREAIVKKGIAKGLVPIGTSVDDPRVDTLIFEPGFSTRDQVSELSGRGVGLDVVRDAVRSLRGSLAVESQPGKGTAFIFRLPLTLALIDGLLVETAGSRYVVPLAQVEECVALNGTQPALSKGRPCVSVRGELVPMVPLRSVFHCTGPAPLRQELLLTRHAGQRVGVAVDKLLGRVQAVIQSLGEGLGVLGRFSGATILGDGSVSLILDLAALVAESRAADTQRAIQMQLSSPSPQPSA